MARRTSRRRRSRRGTRRNSRRRKTRRNPKYVVANRRRRRTRRNSRRRGSRRSSRMRGNRRRRVRKNLLGANIVADVVVPVAGATAGFLAARYAGNMMAMRDLVTTNPKVAKLIAAGVGIPLVFVAGRRMPMIARNSGAIVTGMGMAAAEAWIRDTPLLGDSPAAVAMTQDVLPGTAPVPEAEEVIVEGGDGLSSYYDLPTNRQGQALSAYYETGVGASDHYTASMLSGADPADQSNVEMALDQMENGVEPVSTVIPTGLAMKAQSMPQWAKVRERFASGDRGHAGGLFSRHLFAGMAGG